MSESSPSKVTAVITRVVTQLAVVLLDRDGNVEEIQETLEEYDWDVRELNIRSVHSYQD